ncbi:hypothetical protein FXO38_05534 [Capsicum annuum]|nr:hypothetical protein FXO38_05534 [Capsicum annuum]
MIEKYTTTVMKRKRLCKCGNLLCIGGFAAYVGISNVAAPKQGQVVYISAAAGGVGQLAGQFSKLNNCYVVGSAGTDEKVNDLKYYMFNFDGYFNYKKRRFRGSFNKYNKLDKPDGIHNLFHLVTKRIVMEGFQIDDDNLKHHDEFVEKMD